MPAASVLRSPLSPPPPRWVLAESPNPHEVERLAGELRLPPAVCGLLIQRGLTDAAGARAFLRPHRGQIHAPDGLAGMGGAVERLATAVSAGERVLVHGDYDVDGICGTALLVRALSRMGARALPFVPDRIRDGYDLGDAGLAAARAAGARLIVTTDCGIVAHEAVRRAGLAGIDVIVTDHHTPSAILPGALAVINPNRSDCPYPEKGLAGAAVAYKLAQAVAVAVGHPEESIHALLDLVAIATIADLAPLTSENRALVRWGISVLARTPNPGLRALLRSARLDGREEITAGRIGFVLAPRLNAAGRVGDAMRGVRLLLTDDEGEAESIAAELEADNRRRRELDEQTLTEALALLERDYDPARDRGLVLASDRWHPGVIGIVASRVVEVVHRPTVLIAVGKEEGKGSARSIRGFHLYHAFVECAEHLVRFGGHRAAAGCSLLPSSIDPFREAFNATATRALSEEALIPEVRLDGELALSDATPELCRMLHHFGPFGIANPAPTFAAFGVRIAGTPRCVGRNHLKLAVSADDRSLDAIGFGMADRMPGLGGAGARVDIAFRLEENRWVDASGRERPPSLQARLVDIRRAG